MTKGFRIPSSIKGRLEDLGVRPAEVLRQAGLPQDLFDQEKIVLGTEDFFAFYRGLERAGGDPAIGLKLGTEQRIERYDPVAIAAVSARSFRDALGRLARYKQLNCPEEIQLQEQGEETRVHFRWMLAVEAEPPFLEDLCFAWIVGIARRGSGGAVRPLRIELGGPERSAGLYEEHLGCPVRAGCGTSAAVFSTADLDRPFLTHNADLLAALIPQLENELSQAPVPKALGDQVKGILKRQLAGRRPAIEDVAKELRLSARTLQRRLAGDGATFQQLIQQSRRELARHYLLHSTLELNETAYLLGYEDAHSFFRAFQGWEGTPPGEWRARNTTASPGH